ncbi:MAG: diaminopimelate decarboxylase [Candidatus Delongbacteria bacterium]|nr:diaminopimelate decarboxylase [Candidatus Delongbacteria bacterium]
MQLNVDGNVLHLDGVSFLQIAREFGTPTYIYSQAMIQDKIKAAEKVLDGLDYHISFAMKANSNINILNFLRSRGLGADAVSLGEMKAAERAGYTPDKIILNGNGKTMEEFHYAISKSIFAINVDSYEEFQTLKLLAKQYKNHEITLFLRINPDIDPKTHPYISTGLRKNKFGINFKVGTHILQEAEECKNLRICGCHMHIGSQLLDYRPFLDALKKMEEFYQANRKYDMPYLNLGGGWGIDYLKDGNGFPLDEYRRLIIPELKRFNKKVILELGRYLIADSCFLLGTVLQVKATKYKNFIVTDIGMNDLIRPSLYQAFHYIEPVETIPSRKVFTADIVGPICETGDKIAENYPIRWVKPGEHLVVYDTGAYGFSMASNYNLRLRGAEVLIHSGRADLIRPRESYDRLFDYPLIPIAGTDQS